MYVSVSIIAVVMIVLLFIILRSRSLNKEIQNERVKRSKTETDYREVTRSLTNEINIIKSEKDDLETKVKLYQEKEANRDQMLQEIFESNLKAFPYLAGIMADFKTAELLKMEKQLEFVRNFIMGN